MNKKNLDLHIANWKKVDVSDTSGMFTKAEIKNIQFSNIWALLSPILKFLAKTWLMKVLKPSWVKAIELAIAAIDEIEKN